jgi:hypothetical protein
MALDHRSIGFERCGLQSCGKRGYYDDVRCGKCGSAVQAGEHRCSSCGAVLQGGDTTLRPEIGGTGVETLTERTGDHSGDVGTGQFVHAVGNAGQCAAAEVADEATNFL